MMNKFFTKKSLYLVSVILGALLFLAFAFSVILGVNYAVNADSHQTVTVKVNDFHYNNSIEGVEDVCEKVFKDNGLKYVYVYHGAMSADGELVYVFKSSADLATVSEDLVKAFEAQTDLAGSTVYGAEVFVQTANETVLVNVLKDYAGKTVLAIAVFAVLAFVYVALRYRLNMGLMAALSAVLGGLVSAAIILLVRIPVTTSLLSVVVVSAMLSTAMTLLVFNKLRQNLKSEEFADKSAEEMIVESFACKEIFALISVLGVAIVLVGAISRLNVFFFALTALIGLVCATLVGAGIVPAAYTFVLERMKKVQAQTNKSGYVGAAKKDADNE